VHRLVIFLGDRFNQVPTGMAPRDIFDSKMARTVNHFWWGGIEDFASEESEKENVFGLFPYVRNRLFSMKIILFGRSSHPEHLDHC
jgi:hypothetical protein